MKREVLTIALALLVAALAGSVLIWVIGRSPLEVYGLLLKGTWGTPYGIGQVLFNATPLIMTGLSVAVAFKVGLFNIGAEGQLAVGSFATALCGTVVPASWPGPIAVALCVLAGMLAGAALSALAGVLKVRYGAHEVINTIMLNFITSAVILWVGKAHVFVKNNIHTKTISDNATLHGLGITGSSANTSLLLALAMAAAIAYFFNRTRRGFEWRAVGLNQRAAQNGGVRLPGVIIGAMSLSGALAGAVGANYVLGDQHYYEPDTGSGVGFMGIAVALLGRGHPAGIVAAALLMGTLQHGGLAVSELVPKELFQILRALIILTVACAAAYRGHLARKRKATTAATPPQNPAAQRDPAEGMHG
jgi:general nucleoside transport system permease protein